MNITCGKETFILADYVRARTSNLVRKLLPSKESRNLLLLPKVKEGSTMKKALDILDTTFQFWSLKILDAFLIRRKNSVTDLSFGLVFNFFFQSHSLDRLWWQLLLSSNGKENSTSAFNWLQEIQGQVQNALFSRGAYYGAYEETC